MHVHSHNLHTLLGLQVFKCNGERTVILAEIVAGVLTFSGRNQPSKIAVVDLTRFFDGKYFCVVSNQKLVELAWGSDDVLIAHLGEQATVHLIS
jgi:hypothetical protein